MAEPKHYKIVLRAGPPRFRGEEPNISLLETDVLRDFSLEQKTRDKIIYGAIEKVKKLSQSLTSTFIVTVRADYEPSRELSYSITIRPRSIPRNGK